MLALPEDFEQMRAVSQVDVLLLFERMHALFGLLLMDANGLLDAKCVGALARVASETWLVRDQSRGSLAALQRQINMLQTQHVCSSQLKLVINRYDERYGMTAAQIARRFGLQLIGTLPDRPLPLTLCGNQGKAAARNSRVRPLHRCHDRVG
jgi:pilus assembly protein CpaE